MKKLIWINSGRPVSKFHNAPVYTCDNCGCKQYGLIDENGQSECVNCLEKQSLAVEKKERGK